MTALRRLLLGLGAMLLLGLVAVAFMSRHSFRKEPVPVEVGLHGEALEDQTLLLEKWLRAEGRTVTRGGGLLLPQELPEGGTLILLHLSHPVSDGEAKLLLDWVRRGGVLITDGSAAPFNDGRSLAALHKALGVTLKDLKPDALDSMGEGHDEHTMTILKGETPYRIRTSNRWRLEPSDPEAWHYRLGNEKGFSLLNRQEGEGVLSLTPDLSFLYREGLTELDHAAYFQRLLPGPHGNGARVVVWSRPVKLSLFAWLWDHAWPAILALLALVGAWLWRGWPRFGPLMPEPLPERRSLLEHLSASARLMWRGGASAHLVSATRESLERRAQRLNPAYASLDLGARAQWLAEATGGQADLIAAALDDRPAPNAEGHAQALVTLEQLRQRL
ncbi:MAG TPA: DUF4350 domain-containing protein [Holophagaceae bacterium]|nr:DUF4350 domain-containing protein [Holophagaceae bacterium]